MKRVIYESRCQRVSDLIWESRKVSPGKQRGLKVEDGLECQELSVLKPCGEGTWKEAVERNCANNPVELKSYASARA